MCGSVDVKTVVFRGDRVLPQVSSPLETNPPVAWLMTISGPGKGQSVTLYLGENVIGLDAGQRVVLYFGDTAVTMQPHAVISYETQNRCFYLQNRDAALPVFCGDQPVSGRIVLQAGAHLRICGTVLRFVPLCGESFCWCDDVLMSRS